MTRQKIVQEAMEELWQKTADMQAGVPLDMEEWEEVLERLRVRLRQALSRSDWLGSLNGER